MHAKVGPYYSLHMYKNKSNISFTWFHLQFTTTVVSIRIDYVCVQI